MRRFSIFALFFLGICNANMMAGWDSQEDYYNEVGSQEANEMVPVPVQLYTMVPRRFAYQPYSMFVRQPSFNYPQEDRYHQQIRQKIRPTSTRRPIVSGNRHQRVFFGGWGWNLDHHDNHHHHHGWGGWQGWSGFPGNGGGFGGFSFGPHGHGQFQGYGWKGFGGYSKKFGGWGGWGRGW